MSLNVLELLTGIYTRLDAQASYPVYSLVPPNTNTAHIRIDGLSATERSGKDSQDIHLYDVMIHCFSFNTISYAEVSAMMTEVQDALRRAENNVIVSGYKVIRVSFVTSYVRPEGSAVAEGDRVLHGMLNYQIEVQDT